MPQPVEGESSIASQAAVTGKNVSGHAGGIGVMGLGYNGVRGDCDRSIGIGVRGIFGGVIDSEAPDPAGVAGENGGGGAGVRGLSTSGDGVYGQGATGVHGASSTSTGVAGMFDGQLKVNGNALVSGTFVSGTITGTSADPNHAGVHGIPMLNVDIPGVAAIGVLGEGGAGSPPIPGVLLGVGGRTAIGVKGTSADPYGSGVWGENPVGMGVYGLSENNDGVVGKSHSAQHSGVWGDNNGAGNGVSGSSVSGHGVSGSTTSGGVGVYGKGGSGGDAGRFEGNVTCTGVLTVSQDIILTGADCAEEFDIVDPEVNPGTVVVIANEEGALRPCDKEYEKTVAGVISGAGGLRPGIVLDRQDRHHNRLSVALVGKVCCKVDAQYAPIGVGDLLTTSPTTGHAMKASDPYRAFGAVIGKALRPLKAGRGLVPILVALQ